MTTIVNRMLGRKVDKKYTAENMSTLRIFNDVESSFWAFDHILEATNGHDYEKVDHIEFWESHTER